MEKRIPFQWLIGILLVLTGCTVKTPELRVDINWPTFMAKQDLVWDLFPGRWENAPFNGNGLVGSMIYGSQDSSALQVYLCRSDIGKLDYPGHFRDGNRIQLGSIDLKPKGKILFDQSTARLKLWDAEIVAQIKTTEGAFKLRTFVALDEPVLIVETFDFEGNESPQNWQPNFANPGEVSPVHKLHLFEVQDQTFHERTSTKSGGHVIAWKENIEADKHELRLSIHSSPSTHSIWNPTDRGQLSAQEDALRTFANIKDQDSEVLFTQQAEWWHDFYQKSFVSFKQKELESYYWIQLYKMAASSRAGYPMIDNHGIWSTETVYGFATWDLNVQIIYRLHLAANHLELGEPLIRFLQENYNRASMLIDSLGEMRAGLRQQTFLRYHYFDPINWEHDVKSPCDGPAKLLWGCHNYWLHFQYTQDSTLLPQLHDLLEGGINAMQSGMEKEADGKWHIPYGHSWETWRGKNPNAHLGVLNWALETIIRLEKDIEKQEKWVDFKTNLTDYAVGQDGYMLGVDKAVKAHRHWSHLLHLFPLRTTQWEENKALYQKSVDSWADLSTGIKGNTPKAGYAPCGAACLYAQMGPNTRIDSLLNIFLYQKSSRGPNVWASTMYREYGPVIETPLFFAATLQELFLQSNENVVKVFPALSKSMEDITFHNYRTEGGFLISAKRLAGKTIFIQIKNLQGNPLQLKTDIQDWATTGTSTQVKMLESGTFDLRLKKGETILLYQKTFEKALSIESVKNQKGFANAFGLNQRFFAKRKYMKTLQFKGR